jgi:hypothetical protein
VFFASLLSVILIFAIAPRCPAADFYADDQESLEKAIDDAAGSADTENFINLGRLSIGVTDAIVIDAGFGPDRRLTIRPRPGLASRAQIRSINGAAPVVNLSRVGHVTLQDLDLLRTTYNRSNILHLTDVTNVVVERCRAGSVSSSGGQAGTANIGIFRPVQVVVRNTICFAYAPGTFDRGILVNEATASQAGLWLYNNLVADHRRFGIDITASGDSTLVLRNNVVVNHPTAVTPEPAAYRSMVDSFTRVISSHNVAFASPVLAKIEQRDWDQDIANADQPDFFQRDRPSAALALHQTRWATQPAANPNWSLFRLRDDGPLHQGGSVRGFAFEEDEIDPLDIAFADDIERDARPSDHGGLSHFDRGPDQWRPLTAADITLELRPRLRGVEPVRLSGGRFEVVAVGPQEDLPDIGTVMSGGDYTAGGKLNGVAGMALALPRPVTIPFPELPRSTFYDGTAGALTRFTGLPGPGLGSNVAMTVEAWVRRENPARTEAILAHNRATSFWFGFAGPRLRYYRSGQYAESTGTVAALRWTHVAAAYDGSRVGFFIDGRPAGANLLGHSGGAQVDTVQLGGDEQGANFRGLLDEVRLWDHSRSEQEIRATMFDALEPRQGLLALFPSGGPLEAINGLPGQPGPGVFGREITVLREPLRIPRAIHPMAVDGEVDPDGEYVGAAELVIRYDDGPDATAYLVHDGEPGDGNLYVAFRGLHDVPNDRDRAESWVTVGLDPNGSGAELASTFDLQFRGFLRGDPDPGRMFTGDGVGGFNYYDLLPASNGMWHVAGFSTTGDLNPPDIEFRIPKSSDWGWREPNRLMIGHFDLAALGDNFLAPGGVVWNSPATWPEAIYVENSADVPRVSVMGYVYAPGFEQDRPVPGQSVELVRGNGVVYESAITDGNGAYAFSLVPVVAGDEVIVRLGACENCLHFPSRVSADDIQPVRTSAQSVVFPAPDPGNTRYAGTVFYLRPPIGSIVLTRFSPSRGAPRMRLRESPLKELPPDRIVIEGENLHPDIQVFLSRCPLRPLETCGEDNNHYEVPREQITVGADGTRIEVEIPSLPAEAWAGNWTWWVKDLWVRPAQVVWQGVGGTEDNPFHLQRHEYPLVDGFEFDNRENRAWWQDFDGVYGENGWLPFCVRDPLYVLWFPLFKTILDSTDGVCHGMSATSLLLHHGDLDATDDDYDTDDIEGALFAAGLGRDRAEWRNPACAPYEPINLFARIRANHGIQLSAECIQVVLDQIQEGVFEGGNSIAGDPVGVLNRVRDDPEGYVLTMIPELGSGHVVTPYAVQPGVDRFGNADEDKSLIWIYDNNWPQTQAAFQRRFIEIQHSELRQTYYLPRKADANDEEDHWMGDGIASIPLSVFRRPRTAPGLLTVGDLLLTIIAGGADGLHSSADGEWGWREDGTAVDNLRGARAFVPVGGPNSSTRNVLLFTPATNPPPSVQINVRGSHYYVHAAQAGRMFQLEQWAGVAGDRDYVSFGSESNLPSVLHYTPQRRADNFRMRVGLMPSAEQRLVFEWSGLSVSGGEAVGFRALPSQLGAEFINDGSRLLQPTYTVTWADVPVARHGTRVFGPFEVPPGAVQRIVVQDWPAASQLRHEIDLNRDGTPDRVEIVGGSLVPPLELSLNAQVDSATGQLVLSWPMVAKPVELQTTTSLNPPAVWKDVTMDPEVVGQTVRATLPPSGSQQFFRLRY